MRLTQIIGALQLLQIALEQRSREESEASYDEITVRTELDGRRAVLLRRGRRTTRIPLMELP